MTNPPTNNPLIPPNMLPGIVGPPAPLPPSSNTAPNNPQAAVAAAALNAMKQAQLTANQQPPSIPGSASNNLPTNPNLNLIGGTGGPNTSPGTGNNPSPNLHGQSVSAEQQRRQQQEQLLQKQMLLSLSSQAQQQQQHNPANLLNPLEAHSLKITEYMR